MNYREENKLDQSLQQMDAHTTWNKERQQRLRNRILLEIEQKNKGKQKKSYWPKKFAPILAVFLLVGLGTTLLFSEFSKQLLSSNEIEKSGDIEMAQESDTVNEFSFVVSKETEVKIKEIEETGFDLRLPAHSISEQVEVNNLVLRNETVSASYYYGEERLFHFTQDSFGEANIYKSGGIKNIIKKATDVIEINGKQTYITVKETSGPDLNELYMITDTYGFGMHSYNLTVDELVEVAESIDVLGL